MSPNQRVATPWAPTRLRGSAREELKFPLGPPGRIFGAGRLSQKTPLFRYYQVLPEIRRLTPRTAVPETGFRNQGTVNSRFASFRYQLPPFAMKKLGYARVSTSEQVLALQLDALR